MLSENDVITQKPNVVAVFRSVFCQ